MIIVTLTKNSALTINDTIQSIKEQTIKNLFWFVFDDKSTDSTVDKIKKTFQRWPLRNPFVRSFGF